MVAGIWLMALRGGRTRGPVDRARLGCAVLTAAFICAYTLSDALGARANGAAVAYSLWLFAVNGAVMAVVLTFLRGPRVFTALQGHWRAGLGGGAMSLGAYTTAIWAMTRAPVAMVSGLRETSVLFAVLIGATVLKEPLRAGRIAACAMILAGVVTMRLG
ncbi:MAG: EamA family transporter [Burkholderiaceae bacterium]|nr:EamA family transporter [Burkholderiaceae bacterium]